MDNKKKEQATGCSINKLQKVIGGKWKIIILWKLHCSTKRYVYQEVPPKVEYSLDELGKKFIPILDELYDK